MKLIIYGCGGHARSVADVALSNGITELVFVDQHAKDNETLFQFPVLKTFANTTSHHCTVAIGDNQIRSKLFNDLVGQGSNLSPLIAENAYLGKDSRLDDGVFVANEAYIGPMVSIGENTIINTRSLIEHECKIGKHCHISINATLAGKCKIGDFVMIGANATVIDGISICSHTIIGAGAVVVADITEPGIYVGIPAKKLQAVK